MGFRLTTIFINAAMLVIGVAFLLASISGVCLGACAGQAGQLLIDSAQVASVDIAKQGA